jgi:hypothetical protein
VELKTDFRTSLWVWPFVRKYEPGLCLFTRDNGQDDGDQDGRDACQSADDGVLVVVVDLAGIVNNLESTFRSQISSGHFNLKFCHVFGVGGEWRE